MARYFTIHNFVSYHCGLLTIQQHSNTSQHLWLLWSTITPYVRPIPDRRQNGTVPHQNNLSVQIQGDIEQEEPGNTTVHTFHLPWPTGATQIFFYSINQGTAHLKSSRSPIFAYELATNLLLYEQWTTQPNGDLNWQPGTGIILTDLQVSSPFGIATPLPTRDGVLFLDLSLNDAIVNTSICDLAVSLETYLSLSQPNANLIVSFSFIDALTSAITTRDLFVKRNSLNPCAFFLQGDVESQTFAFGLGYRLPLTQIYDSPPGPCGNIPGTSPDPRLHSISISCFRVGPPNSFGSTQFVVARVQLTNIGGPLTDISGEWRGRRLAPFLP